MIHLNAGDRFGDLTVIGPAPPSEKYPKKRMWQCRCVCGNEIDVPATYLTHGSVTSCGCRQSAARKGITGQRFGKLVAISPTGESRKNSAVWLWCCDCGNTVEATFESVRWGGRTSCGCEKARTERENAAAAHAAVPLVNGTNLSRIAIAAPQKNNTSGRRGVHWHKGQQKWCATIGFKGKHIHLGYFEKMEDAVKARERAEEEYYAPMLEAHKK